MTNAPRIGRVSFHDAATDAAPEKDGDPGYKPAVAREAMRLEPLQKVQLAFDQVAPHADRHARGEPWEHAGSSFKTFVAGTLADACRHRDVLRTAADAADAMIDQMTSHVSTLEDAMNQDKNAEGEHPQLTTDGSPHPLEEGGYDANTDPGLPGNISDVEALKEGKTTRAQAEAIGAADAAKAEEKAAEETDEKAKAVKKPKG